MENDTTVLCDTDDNNRHYFVKKDTHLPPNRCSQRMIITCISVQALALVVCLIVLIAYVANTPTPSRSSLHISETEYQETLKEGEVMERLTSSEDQIEDVKETLYRLMGQLDVSNTTEYQETLKEGAIMERLTSSEDQIEDVKETLYRLMGQLDVSNTTEYQETLKEGAMMERLTSSEDQIEDVKETLYRLMGQLDTITGSSSKQIRPSALPTTPEGTQCKIAGATYVRWGRAECPESADLVYSGFAAGGKGAHWEATAGEGENGGGSNYLCLTNNPHFNQSEAGQGDARGRIYGVEYRSGPPSPIQANHAHDAPCALCQSKGSRSQMIMTPSSTTCPDGWNKEYDGYLVAARWNNPRTEYVCLDRNPAALPGTDVRNENSGLSFFYQVEIVTTPNGGLPAAYQSGKELACAVCTM